MKKTKLGLSLLTGLTTLSVAMPLATSCGKNTKEYTNHVHESAEDKLYGINVNTYEGVKKDYISQFQDQLLERGYIEGSEEWNNEINKLNYSLNIFDEKSKTMNMSYGQLTTGVMYYAKRTNGLSLQRTTSAKPSDVDDMYQGARNSFDLYMDQLGFSSSLKTRVLNDADGKFATLKTQLQEKGTMENDPYGALQEARSSLLGFFELINAEISRFASLTTLSNFRKLYTLVYKDTTHLNDLLDNPDFQIGKPISNDLMNQIFVCIDNENGSPTTFRNDIMAGYVLTPVLREVKIDQFANDHEVDIEWSCISNTYVDSNDAETIKDATAYDYDTEENKFDKLLMSENPTINEIFNSLTIQNKPSFMNVSLAVEKSNLRKTYFDADANESITFKMPDASDPHAKLDPFYMSSHGIYTDDEGVTHDGELSLESLADTGIMISFDGGETFEYLTDVMNTVADPEFDVSKANLVQKLILNCELRAKVHEIDKAKHNIGIELWAKYKNSTFAKDDIDSNWDFIVETSCSGYPISEETFKQFSMNYSKAYEFIDMYKSKKIDESTKAMIAYVACVSIYLAVSASLTTLHGIATFKILIKKTQIKELPWTILGFISGLASIGLLTYATMIYSKRIQDNNEFSKALSHFNKQEDVEELVEKVNQDSNVFAKYDTLKGELKDSDKVYNAKYDAFKNGDLEQYIKLDNYYKQIPKEDGWFNKLAKSMPVDVSRNAYQNILDQMNDEKNYDMRLAGLFVLIDQLLIVGLAIDLVFVSVSVLQDKPAVATTKVEEQQKEEQAVQQVIVNKQLEQSKDTAELHWQVVGLCMVIFLCRREADFIRGLQLKKQISQRAAERGIWKKQVRATHLDKRMYDLHKVNYKDVIRQAKAQRPDLFVNPFDKK